MKLLICIVVILLGIGVYIAFGLAKTMFSTKTEQVVLFSPLEGILTLQGQPVEGVRLDCKVVWEGGDKESISSVVTDAKGFFAFDVLKDDVEISPISTFVVNQYIDAFHEGNEISIWVKAKRGKGLYAELGGKPVNLSCELTDSFSRVELPEGPLGTPCKWEAINSDYHENG